VEPISSENRVRGMSKPVRRWLTVVAMAIALLALLAFWPEPTSSEPTQSVDGPITTTDPTNAPTQRLTPADFCAWIINLDGQVFHGLSLLLDEGGTIIFPLDYGSASLVGEGGTILKGAEDGVGWILYWPTDYPATRLWEEGKVEVVVPPEGEVFFLGWKGLDANAARRTWADVPRGLPPVVIKDSGDD
jgi:hypothetical protein